MDARRQKKKSAISAANAEESLHNQKFWVM